MHLKRIFLICAVINCATVSHGTVIVRVDPYQKCAEAVLDGLEESLSRFRRQKSPEAEADCRERIAMLECMLGTMHGNALMSRHQFAKALEFVGRHKEAGEEYRALIAIYGGPLSEPGTYELGLRASFGRTLFKQGKVQEAEKELREGVATAERRLGPAQDVTLEIRKTLARCLISQGRYAEALNELSGMATVIATALWTNRERILEDRIRLTLNRGVAWGIALSNQGNHALAEMVYRVLLALPVEKLKGGEYYASSNRVRLASALQAQGKHEESDEEWQAAIAGWEQKRDRRSSELFFSGLFGTCIGLAYDLEHQKKYPVALKFATRARQLAFKPAARDFIASHHDSARRIIERLEYEVEYGHPPPIRGVNDFIVESARRDAVTSLNRAVDVLNRSFKRGEPQPKEDLVK